LAETGVPAVAVDGDVGLRRAIERLRDGAMVVVAERSNEIGIGFVVAVAETVTAEQVAEMLRSARGIPWVALPASRCQTLGLGPQAPGVTRPRRPASHDFMKSIEAKRGTTTGVSAHDRALTIRVAAAPASTAMDLISPGHVTPVRVPELGTLARPGAAEAAVDLAGLAGAAPAAAICQILDDTGEPPTAAGIAEFAERQGLPLVSATDVLDRRLHDEPLVRRTSEAGLASRFGELTVFTYLDMVDGLAHFAVTHGDLTRTPHVRIHVQDPVRDVFDDGGGDGSEVQASIELLWRHEAGVLLYLAPTAGLAAEPADDVERARLDVLAAKRRAHVSAQLLRDLGITAIRGTCADIAQQSHITYSGEELEA
jgi:3,4-dihydroxy 2-butanone 4-phosphate synthase/GTP cyclohydrolase II